MLKIFFFNMSFMSYVEKYFGAQQAIDRTAHAQCIPDI